MGSVFVCILTVSPMYTAEMIYSDIFRECFDVLDAINKPETRMIDDMNRATAAWVTTCTKAAKKIEVVKSKVRESKAASSPSSSAVNVQYMIDSAVDPNDSSNEWNEDSTQDDSNSHTGNTTFSSPGDVVEMRVLMETCSYDEVSQGGSDAHVISAQRE